MKTYAWRNFWRAIKMESTQVWSGRVTHLKRNVLKTCFFLLSTCEGHISPSCGTLICLLSVVNAFKTCIIYVDLEKALVTFFPVQQINSNFKQSCQIDRGHFKVPQKMFWYSKYVGNNKIYAFETFLFKCVTRQDRSEVLLMFDTIILFFKTIGVNIRIVGKGISPTIDKVF